MAQFALYAPTQQEIAAAVEGLRDVFRLVEAGELDLPAYLTRLLRQLEETLQAARPNDSVPAIFAPSGSEGSNYGRRSTEALQLEER